MPPRESATGHTRQTIPLATQLGRFAEGAGALKADGRRRLLGSIRLRDEDASHGLRLGNSKERDLSMRLPTDCLRFVHRRVGGRDQ